MECSTESSGKVAARAPEACAGTQEDTAGLKFESLGITEYGDRGASALGTEDINSHSILDGAIYKFLNAGTKSLPLHVLGNSISREIGSKIYKRELRGTKLVDYLKNKVDIIVSDGTVRLASGEEASSMETGPLKTIVAAAGKPKRAPKREMDGDILFQCPHCDISIIVAKRAIRCGVFRHAVYKSNGRPIPPHSKQAFCEQLLVEDKVFGCAQPFRLIVDKTSNPWSYSAEKCGWI